MSGISEQLAALTADAGRDGVAEALPTSDAR
jgi:hypothetical protein